MYSRIENKKANKEKTGGANHAEINGPLRLVTWRDRNNDGDGAMSCEIRDHNP